MQDAGEEGAAGVTVRLLDASDTVVASLLTDAMGGYLFSNLAPGDYRVEVALPNGDTFAPLDQSGDDATDSDVDLSTGRTALTTLVPGTQDLTWDAGLVPPRDFGDLPDGPYQTQRATDGPVHRIGAGLQLGAAVDSEADGQPDSAATGDGADEDGVRRLAVPNASTGGWTNGNAADGNGCKLQVSITGGPGVLQAWLDFGSGLQAVVLRDAAGNPIAGSAFDAGTHTITCDVPVGTFNGTASRSIYGRFRLSSGGGLAATGPAPDGEVEDYLFAFGPNAVTVTAFRAETTSADGMIIGAAVALLVSAVALLVGHRQQQRRSRRSL